MARVILRPRGSRLVNAAWRALPEVYRCAQLFRNWEELSRIRAGLSGLDAPRLAYGRARFRLRLWDAVDVQTLWVVFCSDSYRVQRRGPCRTVLDLGANIGAFTVLATALLGARRVIAVEPVAGTYARLLANLELNALGDRVTPVPAGIAAHSGTRTIYLGSASPFSSLYYRGDATYESGGREEIAVRTLDELMDGLAEPEIDVCKMDCEGAEYEALRAASARNLRRIRFICMEYHPQRDWPDPRVLFECIQAAGFACAFHDQQHRLAVFERVGRP